MNVEIRKKATYVNKDSLLEEAKAAEETEKIEREAEEQKAREEALKEEAERQMHQLMSHQYLKQFLILRSLANHQRTSLRRNGKKLSMKSHQIHLK